jgi:hypothetical protein
MLSLSIMFSCIALTVSIPLSVAFVFCVEFMGQAARNQLHGGWSVEYTRSCFFPYWRSVLRSHTHVMAYPGYAAAGSKCRLNQNKQCHNSADNAPSPTVRNHILGLAGTNMHFTSYPTSARPFGTAALEITPQVRTNHAFRRLFRTTVLALFRVLKQT